MTFKTTLGFCFLLPVCQASRSSYRDFCLSNLEHLIGIEACDYFGMQSRVGILIDVYNFGKVCGHVASLRGGGTVTLAAGSEEAER